MHPYELHIGAAVSNPVLSSNVSSPLLSLCRGGNLLGDMWLADVVGMVAGWEEDFDMFRWVSFFGLGFILFNVDPSVYDGMQAATDADVDMDTFGNIRLGENPRG